MLTMALGTNASETGVLAILFPAIRTTLGLTGGDLGIIVAADKLTGAICSPFWVWLARRWNRKAVLVVAAGLWGAWGLGMGFAAGFGSLLLLSCILAAGFGGAPGVITSITSDLFQDHSRGRAVGIMYGALGLVGALAGALTGQLGGVPDGWRVGFWALGGLSVLVGMVIWLLFDDPGVGASDFGLSRPMRTPVARLGWREATGVFRVASFDLMLLSRLLSGHLVIGTFGIFFLNSVRHFPDGMAVLVLPPFGAGVCLGAVGGGFVVDRLHAWRPHAGRILFLQMAQFAFAALAYVATQIVWAGIEPYMICWLAMGVCQGVNPGVNRPIVMSVIRPELRDWAFVVMLVIVEPIGWAIYSLGTGWLGDRDGLQAAFLVVLVGVMVLNGAAITPLYWTYGRDVARMKAWHPSGAALPSTNP